MRLSDESLLVALQSGGSSNTVAASFEQRFGQFLLHRARLQCNLLNIPITDDQDIVAETMVAVLSTTALYRAGGSVWGYLGGLVVNAARKVCRNRQWLGQSGSGVDGAIDHRDNEMRRHLENRELVSKVILRGESPDLMGIVWAIYFEGRKLGQVAAACQVVESTIRRRLAAFYARARFRFEARELSW